jgi:hypothetical protein
LHGEGILVITQKQAVVFTGRGEGWGKGMKRTEREIQTVRKMIGIYCRGHHGGGKTLCEECQALSSYAEQRAEKCPFGEEKPACSQCPIHCYKLRMKEKIGRVMRFSGPKMIYRHPVLALRHLIAKRTLAIVPPVVR